MVGALIAGDNAIANLESWISEEGTLVGSRQVKWIDFDPNFTGAFHVTLRVELNGKWVDVVGTGPRTVGGLAIAINAAIEAARKVTA